MFANRNPIQERLKKLEQHLQEENELLVDAVRSFRELDKVAYRTGLLQRNQSYATQIPWWPLISFLGTFSAGKSTFINHYLQFPLQETGTQAVDDKFTVVCFSSDDTHRVLPGISLDADPRFPFYQMADELEKVSPGEGGRVDSYLQMKTCPSEKLKGSIIIDSPGFDADEQRNSTLRITDYIIDLSDLVLVFFDARHPEPGAMQDTLEHLVANRVERNDSNKFIYVLNQIDTTAREDNPEDVVAAWQRALAKSGLTAGEFFCIYNPDAAVPIEDEALRTRYESKRDTDLDAIHQRIQQVHVERVYRVIGALEKTAKSIEESRIPELVRFLGIWRRGVGWRDTLVVTFLAIIVAAIYLFGQNAGPTAQLLANVSEWWTSGLGLWGRIATVSVLFGLFAVTHFGMRKHAAKGVVQRIERETDSDMVRRSLIQAFLKNTRPRHSLFRPEPVGWGRRTRRRIQKIIDSADNYVQVLNDKYTKPSGDGITSGFAAERSAQSSPHLAASDQEEQGSFV